MHDAVPVGLHPEDHVKVTEQCSDDPAKECCHVGIWELLSEVMDGQEYVDDDGQDEPGHQVVFSMHGVSVNF